MELSTHLAGHLRDVHFGGNWTCSNLKDQLSGTTWQEATQKVEGFNTILALTYHVNYYIDAVIKVLQGEALQAKDEWSFQHPPVNTQADWEQLLKKLWKDAEVFADLVEKLPEQKLWEDFTDKKHGTYYRNLQGIVEHTHYHLGQIVILKKMLRRALL